MDARRALCSWILRVEERSPDLVPQAMEASARREIHIRHRDSAWRSFRPNLHLRTRSSAVSSPRKAPSGRFCISRRAAMTWPGHTGRPIRRTCISARAPMVYATTKVHLLPDRKVRERAPQPPTKESAGRLPSDGDKEERRDRPRAAPFIAKESKPPIPDPRNPAQGNSGGDAPVAGASAASWR
jgi:hypothetical protein